MPPGRDGIRWEKPLIGTVKARNGQPHNAVVALMHHASAIKDLRDPNPQRRYKMVGFGYKEMKGYQTLVSPDGIRWTRLSTEPIAPDADVISAYYSEDIGRFVAFPKIHQQVFGIRRRAFSTIFSDDFVSWTTPVSSFVNDLRDDAGTLAAVERIRPLLDEPDDPTQMRTEFYRVGVYQAESCTVGFARMLMISARGRYGNHQGPLELQLAVSRDLINWKRPFRTPVVEFGELHEWDGAHFSNAAEAIRVATKSGSMTKEATTSMATARQNVPDSWICPVAARCRCAARSGWRHGNWIDLCPPPDRKREALC